MQSWKQSDFTACSVAHPALYFIGSATVVQAQDAELPFVPVLTIGSTALINDSVFANTDGSFTVLGNQQGGLVNGQPVWDLSWDLTLNQDPSIAGLATLHQPLRPPRATSTWRSRCRSHRRFRRRCSAGSITATLLRMPTATCPRRWAPIAISPSIYRGTIDSVTALSLLAANVACVGSTAGCMATVTDDFGLPGPTLPGPAVNSAIGIFLNFSLSPGDRVSFNTSFVVEPPPSVPLPAALPLLLSGLCVGYAAPAPVS